MILLEWEHEKFGMVHVFVIGGDIWFLGREIAQALGFKRPRDAIRAHVDKTDKQILSLIELRRLNFDCKIGSPRGYTLINDIGVKSLIMASLLESLRPIKRMILSTSSVSIEELLNNIEVSHEPISVYVSHFSDGLVKIGVSSDVEHRLNSLERDLHSKIVEAWNTPMLDKYVALSVEKGSHKFFNSQKAYGEYFNIDFVTACNKVEEIATIQCLNKQKQIA